MSELRISSLAVLSPIFLFPFVLAAQERGISKQFRVTFAYKSRSEESTLTREGRLLLTAQDGGMLFEDRAGKYWNITPENLKQKKEHAQAFSYFSKDELASRLKKELGLDFRTFQTEHYIICSNTTTPYSQWCGELFEHLEKTFLAYWKNKGLQLKSPEKPLIAIVFKTKQEFANYAMNDAGPGVASSNGYYSLRSNRIALYDITASGKKQPPKTVAEVRKRTRSSLFNVATIIHEATHQIAFNTGMHVRYADNPVWVTEGMAMFFETPMKKRKNQWKYVGIVNKTRLKQFRNYLKNRRSGDAISSLVSSDRRFADAKRLNDAYSEAWALSYFLLKRNPKAYIAYLKALGHKKQLVFDKPQQRLELFHKHFGKDTKKLDRRFLSYSKRLRSR